MGVVCSTPVKACTSCHSHVCDQGQHHQVVSDLLVKNLFSDPLMDEGLTPADPGISLPFKEVTAEPTVRLHRRASGQLAEGWASEESGDREEEIPSPASETGVVAGERAALVIVKVGGDGSTKLMWPMAPEVGSPPSSSRSGFISRRVSEGELRFPGVGVDLHPAMPGMHKSEFPVRLNPSVMQRAEAQGLVHDL